MPLKFGLLALLEAQPGKGDRSTSSPSSSESVPARKVQDDYRVELIDRGGKYAGFSTLDQMLRAAVLLTFAVAGVAYGFGMSSIPSPHDVSVFWVGNFCAPWLVLSFFAGRTQRSWPWAVVAGVFTDVACVVGFYSRSLTFDAMRWGLPHSAPLADRMSVGFTHWFTLIAPWLLAALLGGCLYGLLGSWWRRSRSTAAGVALALPFLAEPGLWPLRNGYYEGPWFVWAVEVAVGVAVAGVMLRLRFVVSRAA